MSSASSDNSFSLPLSRAALFLALLNINLGNLFYFGEPTARIISFFLALLLIASMLRENWRSQKGTVVSLACTLLLLSSKELGFIGLVGALACLIPLGLRKKEQGQICVFIVTTGLVALFDYGYSHNTLLWYGVKKANHLLMNLIGALSGQKMLFGPHASGFFILMPFIFYFLALMIYSESFTKALRNSFIFFLLILASLTFYLGGQQLIFSRLQLNIYQVSFLLTPFETHWLAFLLFLIPLYFLNKKFIPRNLRLSKTGKKNLIRLSAISLILFSLITWRILHFLPTHHKTVLIYDNLDWSVPEFGYYGERSGGMFGSLPNFLRSLGYRVQVDKLITEKKLQRVNLLVIINLIKGLPIKQAIQDYVNKGGSLLILGDHTGFGFIREPFNELLKPMHISFQFDSAKSFIPSWRDCLGIRSHLITAHVATANDVQIGTGASLLTSYPANPILIGIRAFSDAGNKANSQNGFLGDLRYQKSEWMGDLVLAAETRFGQGKVLVFGDTSSMQNGALLYDREFIQDIFQWLTENTQNYQYVKFLLWFFFLLFLILSMIEHPVIATLALVVSLYLFQVPLHFIPKPAYPRQQSTSQQAYQATSQQAYQATSQQAYQATSQQAYQVAYIDNSHGELFDLDSWQKNSIDGLAYNLMRNLYTPFIAKKLDPTLLANSKMWVFINPTRNFSAKEKKDLRAFMQKGGLILWTANWRIKEATKSFLDGLSFINLPLGPVKEKYKDYQVQFKDAWPIQIKKKSTILLKKGNYPLVVFQRYGRGGVLVISDNRFLLNQNLENINDFFNEGNILFLRDMLKRFREDS